MRLANSYGYPVVGLSGPNNAINQGVINKLTGCWVVNLPTAGVY